MGAAGGSAGRIPRRARTPSRRGRAVAPAALGRRGRRARRGGGSTPGGDESATAPPRRSSCPPAPGSRAGAAVAREACRGKTAAAPWVRAAPCEAVSRCTGLQGRG
eukprot:226604-Prorocentrum_minimum.AAC.3